MPRYIISLGSNIPSGDTEIKRALRWLEEFASLMAATPVYSTRDAYDPAKPDYTNAIAAVQCDTDASTLTGKLKQYEVSRGRVHGDGSVTIDLDIVCRDSEILRPRDYTAPYFVEGLYLLASGGRFSR
ncbi:MAG: 2-amino-4-hydroxy-6-hydroxymethyldihydropteridine diphosphokinase [Muribaculaceae bacterium]|jgi:2-amino-4-hydroxy-6-hydroxymethyldihydropteridine diphosphokinase